MNLRRRVEQHILNCNKVRLRVNWHAFFGVSAFPCSERASGTQKRAKLGRLIFLLTIGEGRSVPRGEKWIAGCIISGPGENGEVKSKTFFRFWKWAERSEGIWLRIQGPLNGWSTWKGFMGLQNVENVIYLQKPLSCRINESVRKLCYLSFTFFFLVCQAIWALMVKFSTNENKGMISTFYMYWNSEQLILKIRMDG